MVSKSVAIALALFTAANAAPTLQSRQADPCQDAYKSCVAAGTPEVACGCTLAACVGEDNARNREFCSSATASLTKASATTAAATSFACNPAHSYPNGARCISTAGALSLVTPAPSASSTGYACNPAHSYPNGATCISTNGALTFLNPAASTAAPAPAKTSAVASAAASAATAAKVAAPGSNPVKVDGKTWSISDMTRYCGEDKTGCDYNFAINANGKTERCTIIRTPGSNAATESWSNQNCTTGSNFKVSWGFVEQPAPAYAVVTVVNGKELAWFGVSNVNGQAVTPSNPFGSGQYGNLPAQQVYTYN